MQDPSRDEGAVNVAVGALDVPAIGSERDQAVSTEGVKPPPAKEEAEEDKDEKGDGTVSVKLVESTKISQGLVEVNPFAALLL